MPLPVTRSQHLGSERDAARALVDRRHTLARITDAGDAMVLQVLIDPRQIVVHGDADAGQMLVGADARELQDVRRADSTRRQDHLAVGLGPLDHTAALGIRGRSRGRPR
jgi:hypothetical protein